MCLAAQKSILESVPSDLTGKFGSMISMYGTVGIVLMQALGLLLPNDKQDDWQDKFKQTEMWRVCFAFPGFLSAV